MDVTVNVWAVLGSAVASIVVGGIWYGPLFGKKYMHAMGLDSMSAEKKAEMKKGMTMTYVWQLVASVVMFYVFAWIMGGLNQVTVMGGVQSALWIWLGFVVPLKLGDALWGGKMLLFWLGIGNMLFTLLAGGLIIGFVG